MASCRIQERKKRARHSIYFVLEMNGGSCGTVRGLGSEAWK